jgi:hypothetical protein
MKIYEEGKQKVYAPNQLHPTHKPGRKQSEYRLVCVAGQTTGAVRVRCRGTESTAVEARYSVRPISKALSTDHATIQRPSIYERPTDASNTRQRNDEMQASYAAWLRGATSTREPFTEITGGQNEYTCPSRAASNPQQGRR